MPAQMVDVLRRVRHPLPQRLQPGCITLRACTRRDATLIPSRQRAQPTPRYWQTVPGGRKTWRVIVFVCDTPFTV